MKVWEACYNKNLTKIFERLFEVYTYFYDEGHCNEMNCQLCVAQKDRKLCNVVNLRETYSKEEYMEASLKILVEKVKDAWEDFSKTGECKSSLLHCIECPFMTEDICYFRKNEISKNDEIKILNSEVES